jgi:quercetin dioxygenase-like cupin family protein
MSSSFRKKRSSIVPAIAVLAIVVSSGSAQEPAKAQPAPSREHYEVITKGLLGASIFPFRLRSGNIVLQARNLIMGPGKAANVPTPAQTIFEMRGGSVWATLDGKTTEFRVGDFFVVQTGSRLDLENRGDVAVMRALAVTTTAGKDKVN